MIAAICKEIELRATSNANDVLETIYFGGGTPSLLTTEELEQILYSVRSHFQLSDQLEITLECNPGDTTKAELLAAKKLGVNRLSLGIQSFDNQQLKWMNRSHNSETAHQLISDALTAGFTVFSIDLMYGLPHSSLEDWKKQLDIAFSYPIDHISAYCLTVEQRTPLAKWVKEKRILPANEEEQAIQFEFLQEYTALNGFEQYEISNFAKNKAYSKHNTAYWQGKPYVGIGPSAHGNNGKERYWNIANNSVYMTSIEQGKLPEEIETLTPKDVFNELLMIGFRTQWGVNKNQLFEQVQPTENWHQRIQDYIYNGEIEETVTHYVLTKKARVLADGIAADLFV